jgi:hypothetical protein
MPAPRAAAGEKRARGREASMVTVVTIDGREAVGRGDGRDDWAGSVTVTSASRRATTREIERFTDRNECSVRSGRTLAREAA